jgi:putative spermidine/putrescine transport system ATP-binding protein
MPMDTATDLAVGEPVARHGHSLTLEGITHRFGAATAVAGVNLAIDPGEMIAFLGPSGCGKSTLLRIIAGFIAPSAGRVLIDGAPVGHLPANRRGVGIVFQNYALFPHMSVAANVAYGLEAGGVRGPRAAARVAEMLALVRMEGFAERMPRQLSGGQQQRVALARALAVEPKVLLLDESFGALDKNLRLDMQIEIKRLQRRYGITTILVTHDQEEALSMADRIAVLNRGAVEQFAPPGEIYDRPATLFVSGFVGTTNVIPGRMGAEAGCVRLDVGAEWAHCAGMAPAGARVVVSVRPEALRFVPAGDGALAGTVRAAMPLGPLIVYDVELADGTPIKLSATRDAGVALARAPGDAVHIAPAPSASCLIFESPGVS